MLEYVLAQVRTTAVPGKHERFRPRQVIMDILGLQRYFSKVFIVLYHNILSVNGLLASVPRIPSVLDTLTRFLVPGTCTLPYDPWHGVSESLMISGVF